MKLRNLTVTVTYQVELSCLEIPDEIYEQIANAYNNRDAVNPAGCDYIEAAEWLSNNILEEDRMFCEFEVDNILE